MIVKKFREDYLDLQRKSGEKENYHPRSIIYLSRSGNFTIRCLSLEPDFSSRKGQLWELILQEVASVHQNNIEVVDKKYGFTRREKEMFKLLIKGLNAVQASKELRISKETAKVHIHNIFRKMGVARRSEILASLQ